jgi:hypothetical protein
MNNFDLIEKVSRVYRSCQHPCQLDAASNFATLVAKRICKDKNINLRQFLQLDRICLSTKIYEFEKEFVNYESY